MRIAVIGASGFVGRHVVSHLLQTDAEVISIDRQKPLKLQEGETYIEADLLDQAQVRHAAVKSGALDAVVWLAASIRHTTEVNEQAREDIKLMVEAPFNFMQSLDKNPNTLVY